MYSCNFSLFSHIASPDLSDFLAADVRSFDQADFGLLFSAGPVFENIERVVLNSESVLLGPGSVGPAGRTTRSSASVHTPASHPGSSSHQFREPVSVSTNQTVKSHYSLYHIYITYFYTAKLCTSF